jgi:hypothetical protein
MQQMAGNLTDSVDGFLRNATYLIHDRDPLFTEAFEAILRERCGCRIRGLRFPHPRLHGSGQQAMISAILAPPCRRHAAC